MEFVPFTEEEKRLINERVRERIRQKKVLRIGMAYPTPIKTTSISQIKVKVRQTIRRLEEESEGEELENVNKSSSPLASDYDLFKSIGFSSKSSSKKPKLDLEESDVLKDSTNTFVKDCTRILFSSSESSNSSDSVCSEREINFKDAEPEAPLTSGSGDVSNDNESYTDSTRDLIPSQNNSIESSEEINILTKEERNRFKKLGNIEKLDIQMDMSEGKDQSGLAKVFCIKEEAKFFTYPGVLMTPLKDNRITYLIIGGKTCRPMERKLEANLFFTVIEGSIILKSQDHRVFDVESNKMALSSVKVQKGQSFFIPAGVIYAFVNENEFEAKLVVFRETISV